MAKHCSQCGVALPKADARFCNICGSSVPIDRKDDTPSGPSQPDAVRASSESGSVEDEYGVKQEEFFEPLPPQKQEVQEEVQKKIVEDTVVAENPASASSQPQEKLSQDVEDAPTLLLAKDALMEQQKATSAVDSQDIEHLNTAQLPLPIQAPPTPRLPVQEPSPLVTPLAMSETVVPPKDYNGVRSPMPTSSSGNPSWSGSTPAVGGGRFAQMPLFLRRISASPRQVGALVGMLVLLVVIGLGIFLFTQQGIARPWKQFSNAELGFALDYPLGWQEKVDSAKSQVVFSDYNQTAQMTVMVVEDDKGDINQWMRQEAEKIEVSDIQDTEAISFGNAEWQQIQGNLVVEGVNYRVIFLATLHENRLYLVMQQAVDGTYDENEHTFFSSMRAAWNFV